MYARVAMEQQRAPVISMVIGINGHWNQRSTEHERGTRLARAQRHGTTGTCVSAEDSFDRYTATECVPINMLGGEAQ